MTLFPESMPRPEPNMEDARFWQHCREQQLRFQVCANCSQPRHPPTPICGKCQSTQVVYREAPKVGRVFTYTVVHHPVHEAVKAAVPYVVAVVEFPELKPVRLVTNIIADPAAVRIGMPVELLWEAAGEGMFLPRFRPLTAG